MKDFNNAYMDIISQMKKPEEMVRRLLPKITPGGKQFRNR